MWWNPMLAADLRSGMERCTLLFVLALSLVCAPGARADLPPPMSAQTLKLPDGPAALKGLGESFAPELATGSGRYGVALEVPPAALAPQLRLAYAAGTGTGIVGMSWALPLLHIYRTTDKGSPRYRADDRFGVAGHGLNDELVHTGSEDEIRYYRLKNEGAFALFEWHTDTDAWHVRLPSGHRYELGASAASRESPPGTLATARWLIASHSDLFGHTVEYHYVEDRARLYLDEIRYQLHARDPRRYNFVRFEYEPRHDRLLDYRYGSAQHTDYRLAAIEMSQGAGATNRRLRRYELTYDPQSPRSLLSGVDMRGETDSDAMPPLAFDYLPQSRRAGDLIHMRNLPDLTSLVRGTATLEDVDGDALPDILIGTREGWQYYQNLDGVRFALSPTALEGAPERSLSEAGVVLADIDGDGQRDLLHTHILPNYRAWPSRTLHNSGPPGFAKPIDIPSTTFRRDLTSPSVKLFDANGDGRTDVLWRRPGENDAVLQTTAKPDGSYEFVLLDVPKIPLSGDFDRAQLHDFNGDGVLDLLEPRFSIAGSALSVWYGTGGGHFLHRRHEVRGIPRGAADDFRLLDIDRDGRTDLLQLGGASLRFFLNRGDGQLGPQHGWFQNLPATAHTRKLFIADMNGNGTRDVVWVHDQHGPLSVVYLELMAQPNAGLLSRIDNGMGLVTELAYQSSTRFALEARRFKRPWRTTLPHPQPLLTEIRTTDSMQLVGVEPNITLTTFRYDDGYYDGPEREFRGFGRVLQTEHGNDEHPSLVTETHFHVGRNLETGQDEEILKGKPLLTEQRDEQQGLLASEQHAWSLRWLCLSELATRRPVLPDCDPESRYNAAHKDERVALAVHDSTLRGLWENSDDPAFLFEEREHDGFGGPTRVEQWGQVELAGTYRPGEPFLVVNRQIGDDERIDETTYLYNLDQWLLGLPSTQTVADGSGNVLASKRTFYDEEDPVAQAQQPTAAARLTQGLPTLVQAYLDEAPGRWVTTAHTHYFPSSHIGFGKPRQVRDAEGRTTRFEVDEDAGHFVVAEHIQAGDEDTPREVSFRADYDFGFGVITSVADVGNETTAQARYDGLGRVTHLIDPLGDTRLHFAYEYAAPLSSVRTTSLLRRASHPRGEQTVDHFAYVDGAGRTRLTKRQAEEPHDYVAGGFALFSPRGAPTREFDAFSSPTPDFEPAPDRAENLRHRYDALGRLRARFALTTPKLANDFDLSARFTKVLEKRYEPLAETTFSERELLEMSAGTADHAPGVRSLRDGLGRVRRIRRQNPTGSDVQNLQWDLDYNGLDSLTRFADLHHARSYEYDALQRLVALHDLNLGDVQYNYDDAGKLVRRVDALGQVQRWEHDRAGRVVAQHLENHPTLEDTTYRYHYDEPHPQFERIAGLPATNLHGRLGWMEFPTGSTAFSYDHEGKAIVEVTKLWDPARGPPKSSFDTFIRRTQYDAAGRVYGSHEGDRPETPADEGLRVEHHYNLRSLVQEVTATLDGETVTLFSDLHYTPNELPTSALAGNGLRSCRTYNARKLVSRAITGRDPLHAPPGDTTTPIDCDALHQSGGRGLYNLLYRWTYDRQLAAVDDVSAISPGVPRLGVGYRYDHIGQLVEASYEEASFRSHRFRFDEIQNLIERSVVDDNDQVEHLSRYFFDEGEHPSPQRLARVEADGTDTKLEYDSIGQLGVYQENSLSYDVLGNLVAVAKPDGTRIEHHFDPTGARRISIERDPQGDVRAVERHVSQNFRIRQQEQIWQISGPLHRAEWKRTQGLFVDLTLLEQLESYVLAKGKEAGIPQPLPDVFMDLNGDGSDDFNGLDLAVAEDAYGSRTPVRVPGLERVLTYSHSDLLGTATHQTDHNGELIAQQVFLPFGELVHRTGPRGLTTFAGKISDVTDLGLVHMGAREYSPALARWLTPDRFIGESPASMAAHTLEAGLYAYAGNNPAMLKDPDGEFFFAAAAIAVSAAIAYVGVEIAQAGVNLANTAAGRETDNAEIDRAQNAATKLVLQVAADEALGGLVSKILPAPTKVLQGAQKAGGKASTKAARKAVSQSAKTKARAERARERANEAATASRGLPKRLARVVPDTAVTRRSSTLGAPGADDVFVTTPGDIAGLDAAGIANRLTIPESPSGFRVIKFDTPASGLASPVNRTNPGFVGGGRTAGGATEFVVPNGPVPAGATTRVVR